MLIFVFWFCSLRFILWLIHWKNNELNRKYCIEYSFFPAELVFISIFQSIQNEKCISWSRSRRRKKPNSSVDLKQYKMRLNVFSVSSIMVCPTLMGIAQTHASHTAHRIDSKQIAFNAIDFFAGTLIFALHTNMTTNTEPQTKWKKLKINDNGYRLVHAAIGRIV